MDKAYLKFLESKRHSIGNFGFKANYIPDIAFDFQKHVIEKAVEKGRVAVFSPVSMGRKAIGIELKDSYFKQSKLNLQEATKRFKENQAKQGLITFDDEQTTPN